VGRIFFSPKNSYHIQVCVTNAADSNAERIWKMPRPNSHVSPSILAADHATVMALQSMVDYQPVNPSLSIPQLLQTQATLAQATQARRAAEVALDNARRVEAETSHLYHDSVVSARAYVVVQYGPDSAAVAQVGLTRKSDRKRPTRRAEKAK
jgi:hypothetical protein